MRILIVDDHSVVRRGLQQIIATRPGWQIVGEAANADEVLPILRRGPVDVVILDVSLGDRSGLDVLGHIHAEFPTLPVLMLSMFDEELYAIRSLRAGATGYIEKDCSPEELLDAVARVAAGRTWVSDAVAHQLAREVVHGAAALPHDRLSPREFEVFRLIATGRSVGEIAEALHLSAKTVSTHRTHIMEKTGFRSNADIISYGVRTGLV